MRSVKRLIYALVALMLLVPAVTRVYQKLEARPDLKPKASFRDVDRPPEPAVAALDWSTASFDREPQRLVVGIVERFAPLLPRLADHSGRHTLRPPPASVLA